MGVRSRINAELFECGNQQAWNKSSWISFQLIILGCFLGVVAPDKAGFDPKSSTDLDMTTDFQDFRWASTFRLVPMWNQSGETTVLVAANVARSGVDYTIFCELGSPNLLAHPFGGTAPSRYRKGVGIGVGQYRVAVAGGKGTQGSLILEGKPSGGGDRAGYQTVTGFDTWAPGGHVEARSLPVPIASHRAILDSFALESDGPTSFRSAIIGFGGEGNCIGVHFEVGGESHFSPFVGEQGVKFHSSESKDFPYRASFELGMNEAGSPFVAGFFTNLDQVHTFRFDPSRDQDEIHLRFQAEVQAAGVQIVSSASNQNPLGGSDRFYLVQGCGEDVFTSKVEQSGASRGWSHFEFTPDKASHLSRVTLLIDLEEYRPKGLYGRVEALGFTTCVDGSLGVAATVNSLGLVRKLITLGLGGKQGMDSAALRCVRVDPFSRGIFENTDSTFIRVSEGQYMLLAPTYTSFRESSLGLPPSGSMSIARYDEVHIRASNESYLRPLEVYSLQPQEYLRRKYKLMP